MLTLPAIPTPGVPDANDIKEGAEKGGDLLLGLSPTAWQIIVACILATIVVYFIRKPIVAGAIIGAIIVGVYLTVK